MEATRGDPAPRAQTGLGLERRRESCGCLEPFWLRQGEQEGPRPRDSLHQIEGLLVSRTCDSHPASHIPGNSTKDVKESLFLAWPYFATKEEFC